MEPRPGVAAGDNRRSSRATLGVGGAGGKPCAQGPSRTTRVSSWGVAKGKHPRKTVTGQYSPPPPLPAPGGDNASAPCSATCLPAAFALTRDASTSGPRCGHAHTRPEVPAVAARAGFPPLCGGTTACGVRVHGKLCERATAGRRGTPRSPLSPHVAEGPRARPRDASGPSRVFPPSAPHLTPAACR